MKELQELKTQEFYFVCQSGQLLTFSHEHVSLLARVTETIAQIDLNQSAGTAYRVRQRLTNWSKRVFSALIFGIESGASDGLS